MGELCEILNSDLNSVNPMVRRLNAWRAQPKPLAKGEYESEATADGPVLTVTARFHRNLPFAVPFDEIEDGIVFAKKSQVKAFGMKQHNGAVAGQIDILYYESDDRFVLRSRAGAEEDELLLAKGFSDGVKLSTMCSKVQSAIEKGAEEWKKDDNRWKYSIGEEDEITIPLIRFHLQARYKELINQTPNVKGVTHKILEAMQATAFVLDKDGVILESDAVIVDSAAAVMDDIPVKYLHFDEPFLVILKKKQAENPYFIMKVANAELMEKITGKKKR